jgi:O-succinylbenzoate synthase
MERAAQADWLVVKPAVIDPAAAMEHAWETGKRLVVTSCMDHAIGQMYAAWMAAGCEGFLQELAGDCGLLTHELFEPDPFFECLAREGDRLLPPEGTGLGFDDLIEGLPWKKLI